MPGKVKVKIISGKNLPVMDRSSDTTDAYVEIKLGTTTYKTDVCRRTLHPQWNTDWYRFEVDDSELQDEPLQIRLMDHDTYSANDAIGKVYLNLNPLLLPVAGQLAIGDNNPHHEISGWIPVYDTMHGIRGEVNVTVKVELFSDFNRFRQSSCGVHFFYSPTIPHGYQAKIINGFVEELIVDDDPEYQWIDKIRTPRASNEARQTLFFKLSGELQRKIGVKALGLGGNAVIGYRQCFDLEGESGIVARGIGTAVTLIKSAINIYHAIVETKEEHIENYLKFVGDGKSFSLCSTSPSHKYLLPFSLFDPDIMPEVTSVPSRKAKLTKYQYASLDPNIISPSISHPNLHEGQSSVKVLLNQEDKRGRSAMSRRFQKFKHSQKSLSKKMIALKAKLSDSIGEEVDDTQSSAINKRKLFKRTSSDSSAMAEILARSVIRATSSLSCILEDQPHSLNEDDTMKKLEPIENLLSHTESELIGPEDIASDAQSCSSTESSSSCSDYEYRDYNKTNNEVETISNIITNVERLQRCLSREGLQKQYSLPAIPTKGFSLSSLDNLNPFERSDASREHALQTNMLRSQSSLNESLLSTSTSISNLSTVESTFIPHLLKPERRSSDIYDSRMSESIRPVTKFRKLKRFDEIDLQEETPIKSAGKIESLEYVMQEPSTIHSRRIHLLEMPSKLRAQRATARNNLVSRTVTEHPLQPLKEITSKLEGNTNTKVKVLETVHETKYLSNRGAQNDSFGLPEIKGETNDIATLTTMVFSKPKILDTSTELEREEFKYPVQQIISNVAQKAEGDNGINCKLLQYTEPEPRGMVKTALQTMLIERADILGTDNLSFNSDVTSGYHETRNKNEIPTRHEDTREIKPKGIVDTALQTMLIERAGILGTDSQSFKSDDVSEVHRVINKNEVSRGSEQALEIKPKGILNTALHTMLIERADIQDTDTLSFKSDTTLKPHKTHKENKVSALTDDVREIKTKSIVNTALETMLIERADLLGTPDVLSHKNAELPESHEINQRHLSITVDEKDDPMSEHIAKTALHTMLFERANILNTSMDCSLDPDSYHTVNEKIGDSCSITRGSKSLIGDSQLGDRQTASYGNQSEDVQENNEAMISVNLGQVTIEPKKMVQTAMQTILLEKFNLLGTYTPPTSPNLVTDDKTDTFTFKEVDSERLAISKSSSSASFKEHYEQKETVLGMPFASLSSLISEYDSEFKHRQCNFLSDNHLHQPMESLKEKASARKKQFKRLLSKVRETGQHNNMFHRIRRGSKKSLPDDIQNDGTKEHYPNLLSRMFHPVREEKSIKSEGTQTSNEILECPKIPESSQCTSSTNNLSKTKIFIALSKPPGHKDLASGDFLAHSKTKSACITSHRSSPAQERQDQNSGDKRDEHSPEHAARISHSPVKLNYMVPLHRRSSDSDLSITPKGNSLTGSDKSMGNAAAYFMRSNYIRRGQLNQEHYDMLEYPFLTMTKFPPRFIIQIGGSISARSVKLLERILNVDEPESRDIWWSEIRMEIRSHARSLNCNAVLGYTELTSICDDVCVLSACGTAAVVDFNSSAGDDDTFSNVQLNYKNVERDKHLNGQHRTSYDSPDHKIHTLFPCFVTHLPYDEKSVPLKAKMTKCSLCLKGKVPEVLIATIEPPESIPSIGKGCFIESHVSRPLKDLRGETIAKEISDGLPFLEYELHRLLVNKLKIKGMNAIFSLKIRISVGEKLLVGVATGTAIYLTSLPSPDLPMLVTDKVSDEKVVAELQEMLNQTVKKNKEIYQIQDDNQKCMSDEDSEEELASLDISCGNKDCCILEMDDPEDAEVLRLLMQEKVPDGFYVVSTESVPGLEDLEIVKNLQMFTQIYRAKLAPPYNLQKHFVRLLQSVYFKLRRMVPCALCDLQFRIDLPEPDEIQLCVIGMALGLGKKSKKNKFAVIPTKPEEDLIFKLDDEHLQENVPTQITKSNPSSLKFRGHRSPSKYRPQSIKQRHIPYNERHGVDITPLSYVPGGIIEQYLGNLNFFFIRETTSIREEGGLSGFIHSFITEVLAIVRSHVTALGGNALVAFFLTECVLNHNLHKNQGQCLINVGGDVVSVSYFKDEV